MSKKLVAYFSASGKTAKVAERIALFTGAKRFEIQPKALYTVADLDWRDEDSRSSKEMKNPSYRPEIANEIEDMEAYDVIFLGFPIWWYIAPTIMNTFLESYDFSNKKIILFATAGSSGFGETVQHLLPSLTNTTTLSEGKVFHGAVSDEEIEAWIQQLSE